MRSTLILVAFLCPLTAALAQNQSETFVSGSVALLDRELPQMNRAVAEKDRTYFGPALERVKAFLSAWEKRDALFAIERYSACREAVTDFLIVGLCKMPSPDPICKPTTFFPKAERYIEQCRVMAAQASGSTHK